MGLEGIREYIYYLRNVNKSLKECWREEINIEDNLDLLIRIALYFEDIYYLNTVIKLGTNEGKDLFIEDVERIKDVLQESNKDILKHCGLTNEDIVTAEQIKKQIEPDIGINIEKMFDSEFSIENNLNKIIEITTQLGMNNPELDYMMGEEDEEEKEYTYEDEEVEETSMSNDLLEDILGALTQIKEEDEEELETFEVRKRGKEKEGKKKRIKVKYNADDELAQIIYNVFHLKNKFMKKKGY